MGWSVIKANSAELINRSAAQSGFRTLASGSRDPNARAAAVRIAVREGNPLASMQELSNIPSLRRTANEHTADSTSITEAPAPLRMRS